MVKPELRMIHLVQANPHIPISGMVRLLDGDLIRAPECSGERVLLRDGMVGECDDEALEELRTFCDVTIVASKAVTERPPDDELPTSDDGFIE